MVLSCRHRPKQVGAEQADEALDVAAGTSGVTSRGRLGGDLAAYRQAVGRTRRMTTSTLGALLAEKIRAELEHWSQLFPVQLALWRLLEEARPGTLALKRAGFDRDGPYVVGAGADWFRDVLWDDEAYALALAVLEPVVIHLKGLPSHPFDLVTEDRLPTLEPAACQALARLACDRIDAAWPAKQST
jgi:hypothetical protein